MSLVNQITVLMIMHLNKQTNEKIIIFISVSLYVVTMKSPIVDLFLFFSRKIWQLVIDVCIHSQWNSSLSELFLSDKNMSKNIMCSQTRIFSPNT